MMNNIYHKDTQKFEKNVLSNVHSKISIDDLSIEISGRFDIVANETSYECFVKKSDKKKLIVFLSAAGRTNQNTAFHRVNWSNRLDANLLYIEDPMYKRHKNLRCGWYYGNNNNNYLDGVLDIVRKIIYLNGIAENQIIFVGASSAGYAALYCANKILGSMAYAVNPQLVLKDWRDASNFEEVTGVSLVGEDAFGRKNIKYIQENKESKFFILYNSASAQDKKQTGAWLESLSLDGSDGLKVKGNLCIFVKSIGNHNPHVCVADIDDFISAINFVGMLPDISSDFASAYLNRMRSYVLQEEEAFYSKLWYELIRSGIPNFFEYPKTISKFHLDFKVLDYYELMFYRIFHQKSINSSEVVLYVNKDEISFGDLFIRRAKEVAIKCDAKFKVDEKQGFLRFSRNFKKVENAKDELNLFISEIHLEITSVYTKIKNNIDSKSDVGLLEDSVFSKHMYDFLPWLEKLKNQSLRVSL